jgi:hypothetical protein
MSLRKDFRKTIHFWRQDWPEWLGPAVLLLLLLVSLLGGWLMREAIQEGIVDQMAYLWWVLRLRLRALPQEEVWGLLALLALIHLGMSLYKKLTLTLPESGAYRQAGPVQGWVDTLGLNRRPDRLGRIPLNRLQQLTLMVMAEQSPHTLNDLRAKLRTGTLDIDPALPSFLQTGRSQAVDRQIPVTETPEMAALLDFLEQKVGDTKKAEIHPS